MRVAVRSAVLFSLLGVFGCGSSGSSGTGGAGGALGDGAGGSAALSGTGGAAGDAAPGDGAGGGVTDAPLDVPIGPPTDAADVLDVNGITRSYYVHVPQSAVDALANGPIPLLVGLHGAGDTGENFLKGTQLWDLAAANVFIVVGPDAWPGTGGVRGWVMDKSQGWPGDDGSTNSLSNDVLFVIALIGEIEKSYGIDPKRRFLCGFSRGAGFTGGLATLSDNSSGFLPDPYTSPFAAYAIAAGYNMFQTQGGGSAIDFTLTNPKRPFWLMHGTSDQGVPYDEGKKFAEGLQAAGWDAPFDSIDGAQHNWLWQPSFGHSNQELWDWFGTRAALS